ncbi:hypothetical protein [uncultured Dokdonia sp.]|uniref:hypothetical protein n=1 Tax=uncultured Dokdonia sp. TaxID=575653 RepID=UPI00260713CE|nr:hypothetical protein [uncultured Dokdonia sp.]
MNKIKTILVAMCVVCTVLFSCTTDENSKPIETEELSVHKIGVFEDGEYHFYNEEGLKQEWEQLQREKGDEVVFENISIVTGDLQKNGTSGLILMAISDDKTIKMASEVKIIKDKDGSMQMVRFGTTVECKGFNCLEGCDPEKDEDSGKWKCTACTAGAGCNKTVTVTEDSPEIIAP